MRPTPIPDAEVWDGAVRRVIAPPSGDLTDTDIAPVEALIDVTEHGPRFSMRCELEDGDLATLSAGGVVWLAMLGNHLHPFSVAVEPTAESETVSVLQLVVRPGTEQGSRFELSVTLGRDVVDVRGFVAGCVEALQRMLDESV